MNINTDKLKKVGTSRYTEERVSVRRKACDSVLIESPRILELYAGGGNMTKLYREKFPHATIVRVDNQLDDSEDLYQLDNKVFIESITNYVPFDIIDFDAYGNPNLLIKRFFEVGHEGYKDKPFVIVFTDGLGLNMKRTKNIKYQERFMIDPAEVPDLRHPWRHHKFLDQMFMLRLANKYGYFIKELELLQGKRMNFVFGAFKFIPIKNEKN